MATDRQRDLEAARVGWMTLRIMYEQLGPRRSRPPAGPNLLGVE
jgi:hypothetical protein